MALFKKRAEDQKTEEDALLVASLSDDQITFEDAMKIPTFSACMRLIEDTVSMIPIKLYKRDGDAVTEVKDDQRHRLLNFDTKDTLDGVQFKRAMVRDYYQKGGYAFINRKGNKVESIHYVESSRVAFLYGTDPIFKEYTINIDGQPYEPFQFIKLLRNTKNGWSGTSIVDENMEILNVAYSSLKFEKNLVKSGGNKKGFITSSKRLVDDAIKKLKEAWRRLYQNSSENVVILNEGLDFKESSNTSVEMQLNENKEVNAKEICEIFNMPPEMLRGGATENTKTDFIQNCINHILVALECACNRDLLLETEKESYFFAADTSELTKGDIKKRYEAYEIAKKNGWMQIDEIRTRENLPELGLKFITLGLQDVLYDPQTDKIYVPNMDKESYLKKGGEKKDENRIEK